MPSTACGFVLLSSNCPPKKTCAAKEIHYCIRTTRFANPAMNFPNDSEIDTPMSKQAGLPYPPTPLSRIDVAL